MLKSENVRVNVMINQAFGLTHFAYIVFLNEVNKLHCVVFYFVMKNHRTLRLLNLQTFLVNYAMF